MKLLNLSWLDIRYYLVKQLWTLKNISLKQKKDNTTNKKNLHNYKMFAIVPQIYMFHGLFIYVEQCMLLKFKQKSKKYVLYIVIPRWWTG